MGVAAGLTFLAALLIVPAPAILARARWVRHEPRAALVLWQAVGLSAGLAAVGAGLAVSLRPLGTSLPSAAGAWLAHAVRGDLRAGLGPLHLILLTLALPFASVGCVVCERGVGYDGNA